MTQNKEMNVEEFQPMQNFIIVAPKELDRGEVQTESGLVLATSQNQSVVDKSTSGIVLAVGPKVEDILPGNPLTYVECYLYIAYVYQKQKKFNESFDYYEKALAIYQQNFSSNKQDIGKCYFFMANILLIKGQNIEAIDLYYKSLL